MSDPLLLLLDLQEGVCRAEGPIGASGLAAEVSRRNVLANASVARDRFRERGWPIAYAMLAFDAQYHNLTSGSSRFAAMRRAGLMLRDDPWSRICAEVEPRTQDPVIVKGCVNPFIGTHLGELVNRLQPAELVLGGVATNHVVECAARHAADSGFRVVVLEDLCASFNEAAHRNSIEYNMPFYARVLQSKEYFA